MQQVFRKLCLIVMVAAVASLGAVQSFAGEFPISRVNITPNFKSMKSLYERKFQRVVKQKYDYSCGSASVASLLTYHYGRPTDELTVIQSMMAVGDEDKITKEGFSLLDMKNYLKTLGFEADGFRAPLEKLNEVGIPAIVLLNISNYLHFVVVKGVGERGVLVGDSTLGVRIIRKEDFLKSWNGILFVITSHENVGKRHFNTDEDWRIVNQSSVAAISPLQSLGTFTIHTSLTPNYY